MHKQKMKKELISANDDRFSALWEESEKGCFKPVSKQISGWKTSKNVLEYELLPKWDQHKTDWSVSAYYSADVSIIIYKREELSYKTSHEWWNCQCDQLFHRKNFKI